MDSLRGLEEAASEAPPHHPHCLVTPLGVSTEHRVKRGSAMPTKLPPAVQWKNSVQDDTFLLGQEKKLKIKGTGRHWQETGCGPFQSVAMEKEHLEEAQPVCALHPRPHHRW